MGISLKPEHLKRYKDMAALMFKYGRSDLVKRAGLEEVLEDEKGDELTHEAEELADDIEKMGPTFIKLAQLLSTRADLIPHAYLNALTRLQDNVEPFGFEEVEKIVSTELGVRISKAFSFFEATPIAAASLGQVHRATLRDGRSVVVKVQRPNVRETVLEDMDALESIAEFMDSYTETGQRYEFQQTLTELRRALIGELDYRQEAANLHTIGKNLESFERIIVPEPVENFTTSRVLTMEYIEGRKITSLTPLARIEFDGAILAEHFFHAYLQQLLVDGFFHADPHPGNVFLTDDYSIALIDLGLVGRITPRFQEQLLKLLLSISEGRGDEAGSQARAMGEPKVEFNEANFKRDINHLVMTNYNANLEEINAGKVVLEITRISGECNFRLPPEFTLIAKTLLNMDMVVKTLDPKFDPNASIRRHAMEIIQKRMVDTLSPGHILSTAIEAKEFAENLPNRLNKLLDAVINNEIEIKVDALDEDKLMAGFQKVANRIAMGLVLAALIVGAALLMRIETSFKLLGYPGLAIILFIIAVAAGLGLVIQIVLHDVRSD